MSKLKRLLIILPVVLVFIAASSCGYYLYRYSQIHADQKYVDSWEDLNKSDSTPTPGETTSSEVLTTPMPSEQPTATPAYSEPPAGPAQLVDAEGDSDPIIRIKQKDPDIKNILLIGIDGGDGLNIGHRSDTMLVVSINSKVHTIKLTSIMRDIKAYFPNRKIWDKINASYAYGGPGQTVNVVNYNFDLDIQQYVVVDFTGFRKIVDTIGGVTMDITTAEATQINGLAAGGTYRLTGDQALAFARIRHIDSDFYRVQRQRKVLLSIFADLRKDDLVTQVAAANNSLAFMRSNIAASEITGDLFKLALQVDSSVNQYTVPASGMYEVDSSSIWYINLNWQKQVSALHTFIYGA